MTDFLLPDFIVEEHVKAALKEDVSFFDVTTDFLIENNEKDISVFLNTREDGIICGLKVFATVFKVLDRNVKIEFFFKDGDKIQKNDKIAKITGHPKAILTGERVALNYIQRISAIATETFRYAEILKNYNAKITDTRKNTPLFRIFEKYAVKIGGAKLHRFNLSDCVMIKDNHIRLCDNSIEKAVEKIRKQISHTHKIEVECDTFEQVQQALAAKVDIIMLDNMNCEMMKKCVEEIKGRAIVEASGNVSLETVEEIAKTGVDVISTSSIVAKAKTLDLGLDY